MAKLNPKPRLLARPNSRPRLLARLNPKPRPLAAGMVSPFRVAREAAARRGCCPGAAKFLDEMLTWRELAYAWCAHRCTRRVAHPRAGRIRAWALAAHGPWPRMGCSRARGPRRGSRMGGLHVGRGRGWHAAPQVLGMLHGATA
jgi:hypothetical protein